MKADTARTVAVPIAAVEADDSTGSLLALTGTSSGESSCGVGSVTVEFTSSCGVVSGTVEFTVGEGEVVDSVFVSNVSNVTTSGSADSVHSPLYAIKSATAKQLLSYVFLLEQTGSIFLGQAKAMHSPL